MVLHLELKSDTPGPVLNCSIKKIDTVFTAQMRQYVNDHYIIDFRKIGSTTTGYGRGGNALFMGRLMRIAEILGAKQEVLFNSNLMGSIASEKFKKLFPLSQEPVELKQSPDADSVQDSQFTGCLTQVAETVGLGTKQVVLFSAHMSGSIASRAFNTLIPLSQESEELKQSSDAVSVQKVTIESLSPEHFEYNERERHIPFYGVIPVSGRLMTATSSPFLIQQEIQDKKIILIYWTRGLGGDAHGTFKTLMAGIYKAIPEENRDDYAILVRINEAEGRPEYSIYNKLSFNEEEENKEKVAEEKSENKIERKKIRIMELPVLPYDEFNHIMEKANLVCAEGWNAIAYCEELAKPFIRIGHNFNTFFDYNELPISELLSSEEFSSLDSETIEQLELFHKTFLKAVKKFGSNKPQTLLEDPHYEALIYDLIHNTELGNLYGRVRQWIYQSYLADQLLGEIFTNLLKDPNFPFKEELIANLNKAQEQIPLFERLTQYATQGNTQAFNQLLESHPSIDFQKNKSLYGETIIQYAAKGKSPALIRSILEHEAKNNRISNAYLDSVIKTIFQYHGAPLLNEIKAFFAANPHYYLDLSLNNQEITLSLMTIIESRYDMEEAVQLLLAVENVETLSLDYEAHQDYFHKLLEFAVDRNQSAFVEALLIKYPPINLSAISVSLKVHWSIPVLDISLLHLCAYKKHLETAKLLIERDPGLFLCKNGKDQNILAYAFSIYHSPYDGQSAQKIIAKENDPVMQQFRIFAANTPLDPQANIDFAASPFSHFSGSTMYLKWQIDALVSAGYKMDVTAPDSTSFMTILFARADLAEYKRFAPQDLRIKALRKKPHLIFLLILARMKQYHDLGDKELIEKIKFLRDVVGIDLDVKHEGKTVLELLETRGSGIYATIKTELMTSRMPDYYEILGISRDASDSIIKKAYRTLSVSFHPDKIQFLQADLDGLDGLDGKQKAVIEQCIHARQLPDYRVDLAGFSNEFYKIIVEAHEVLSTRRADYDRKLEDEGPAAAYEEAAASGRAQISAPESKDMTTHVARFSIFSRNANQSVEEVKDLGSSPYQSNPDLLFLLERMIRELQHLSNKRSKKECHLNALLSWMEIEGNRQEDRPYVLALIRDICAGFFDFRALGAPSEFEKSLSGQDQFSIQGIKFSKAELAELNDRFSAVEEIIRRKQDTFPIQNLRRR